MQLKGIFTSQVSYYILGRYLSYVVLFIVSLLSAKYLDTYYFGIYSFILLLVQYTTYIGHVPVYSLNTILSEKKKKKDLCEIIWTNSLLTSIVIIGLIITILSIFLCLNAFANYQFHHYFFFSVLIIVLANLNGLYSNLYRVYGNLWKLLFFQLIIPCGQLFVLFFAKQQKLLSLMLLVTIMANLFALLLFLREVPLKLKLRIKRRVLSIILKRGINLLIYNISFYLIVLSSRTIVAILSTPEQLGSYSLANNLSGAVYMVVGSFAYIYYPKLINSFSVGNDSNSTILLKKLDNTYVTICYFFNFLSFICIPALVWFLPNYVDMIPNFKLLLFAQLFFNQCFGHTVLLIARKKERRLISNAFISIVIVCVCLFFFWIFKIHCTYWAVGVLIAALYYLLSTSFSANLVLGNTVPLLSLFKSLFPWRYLIPMLISFSSIIFNATALLMSAFVCFILLNYKYIQQSIKIGLLYISDKNSLSF